MKRAAGNLLLVGFLLAALFLAKVHNYLLYHAIAEGFSIVIACTIFVVVWNARRVLDNHYLLLIGISLLSSAALDFVHILSYPGMGVFPGHSADLPEQLWISARFIESLSFLVAPLFVRHRLPARRTLTFYVLVTAGLFFAIFTPGGFPECFREGAGGTLFKIASQYMICGIFLLAVAFLSRVRDAFDPSVYQLIAAAILIKIVQEAAFTFHADGYGFLDTLGNVFRVLAFWLLYLALVRTGLQRPHELLFRSLKSSEETLRESEEQFRSLAEESAVGVLVLQDSRIRYVNRRIAEMFGFHPSEISDNPLPTDFIIPEDRPVFEENMRRRLAGDWSKAHTPYRGLRKDGTVINVEVHSAMISFRGRPAIMGTVIDVTNHIQVQEAVRHMAYHDPLTGLPNRALLQDRIENALTAAVRAKRHAALLVLDLDRFKEVNDTLGHALGDQLLTEVAGRLRQAVRESDTVARLGGDEFVVFLPEVQKDKAALQVAEKILESFRMDFVLEGHAIHSSTSIGIARFPEDGKDGKTLLKKADEAMYRAKEAGGNRYEQARAFQDLKEDNPSSAAPDYRGNSL
ncbi:MAG: hypothetical protein CVU61_03615 [Deltaproteobacteria bacterium HGW-Deltaproteobacteria-19]|jgi:diguanylate cyclase (GGDEF)-like protein/PAS domain S-box-containing protein|nr:MAG: hypothetical protein CVU61_03615 [Deltaproteobacteria bacterium HGW-Deltaproteobacteria-19]